MKVPRKRRGNSRFILFFLLIALIGSAGYIGVHYALRNISLFEIETIRVHGAVNLSESFYLDMVERYRGRNAFTFSCEEIEKSFTSIVRIRKIDVSRSLPDGLVLTVTERLPRYHLRSTDGTLYPVDDQLMVLDRQGLYVHEEAPIVTLDIDPETLTPGRVLEDETLLRIDGLYQEIAAVDAAFIPQISEFFFKDDEIVIFEADSGCQVYLGTGDMKKKLNRLRFYGDNSGFNARMNLDLRFQDQLVYSERKK